MRPEIVFGTGDLRLQVAEAHPGVAGPPRASVPFVAACRLLYQAADDESAHQVLCEIVREHEKMNKNESGTNDFMAREYPERAVSSRRFHIWQIKGELFTDAE